MQTESGPQKVRASIVDGIFYPARRKELQALVSQLWQESATPVGRAAAIISPHAAYQYSGEVAASAFRAASAREIETVVLLGPVHRDPVQEIILPESGLYQTPLGNVAVDQELVEELLACGTRFRRNDIPHLEEHCLEVQLPFVQYLFPRARIVPILMGAATEGNARLLANALRLVFERALSSTLLVVSANMSSYFRPVTSPGQIQLLLDLIRGKDWKTMIEAAERGEISTCAAGCITALLAIADLLGGRVEVLHRKSSAEVAKDDRTIVHYAAIALTGPGS